MSRAVAATRPVRLGLRATLLADAGVAAITNRVHNGEAPAGTALPYVVTANPTQADLTVLGGAGASGLWMLHTWAATADEAERLAGALVEALGGAVLAVGGFAHVSGRADLLDLRKDPDSPTPLYHGVVAYRWDAHT